MRFIHEVAGRQVVVVIDGGYSATGEDIVDHINSYYNTNTIDLVVSTHPDADHINGLKTVLENANVLTLMLHQPRHHVSNVQDFSNIEAVDELVATAHSGGIELVEPFQGTSKFNEQFVVLGPTPDYYKELVEQHLREERTGVAAMRRAATKAVALSRAASLTNSMFYMPPETLTDDGETGPRNNTSVISLVQAGGFKLLFTGDAGIPALERAADYYEYVKFGSFSDHPLMLIQLPHHGSRRNIGPTLLDRIIGPQGQLSSTEAIISSAKACEDHPSPKVINAATRRGCSVVATEGRIVCMTDGAITRDGWGPIDPFGPLPEAD